MVMVRGSGVLIGKLVIVAVFVMMVILVKQEEGRG